MSLTLHFHPLSSFCHKVLIALYENDTPFTPQIVDLGDAAQRDALRELWPIGKFPVLRDAARGETVAESSIIIEYLDRHYPGKTKFIPANADEARATRMSDRFFDLHIHLHMQKIVGDRLRPPDRKDPHGIDDARTRMATALAMVEQDIASRNVASKPWAIGETFTMADCAAAPALFYADKVAPFAGAYPNLVAYLERLKQRPSYACAERGRAVFPVFPAGVGKACCPACAARRTPTSS
jgi:glutathione S-transferase